MKDWACKTLLNHSFCICCSLNRCGFPPTLVWSSVTAWSRIPRHAFIHIPRYKAVSWNSARFVSQTKKKWTMNSMFWHGNHDTFWTFKPRCSYTESNMNSFSNRQYYIVVARQPHQKKDIFFWDRSGTRKQVYLTNLSWEAKKWIREVIKVYLWDWWVCWDISGLLNCFCLQDQKENEENIFKNFWERVHY